MMVSFMIIILFSRRDISVSWIYIYKSLCELHILQIHFHSLRADDLSFQLPLYVSWAMFGRSYFRFRWRCGLVVESWFQNETVLGSSPGCDRSTLSPWERFFTCISSPHSCKTSTQL